MSADVVLSLPADTLDLVRQHFGGTLPEGVVVVAPGEPIPDAKILIGDVPSSGAAQVVGLIEGLVPAMKRLDRAVMSISGRSKREPAEKFSMPDRKYERAPTSKTYNALAAGLVGRGCPMLLASLAAMGGGMPYLPVQQTGTTGAHRSDVAPARAHRSSEEAAERIAKAEAKRARKWGGR